MTKAKKCTAVILAVVTGLALLLALSLFGVEQVAMDPAVYEDSFIRHDQAASIGIDAEELNRIVDELIAYLKGKRDNLDGTCVLNGEEREIYTEREKLHMIDVQKLFLAGYTLRRVCVVIAVAGLLAMLLWLRRDFPRYFMIGYLSALGVLLTAGGILGICVAVDFTSAFIQFHQIFFDNDYWLLYADNMLIMMFPEEFFNEMTIKILLKMLEWILLPLVGLGAYACVRLGQRRLKHGK